MSKDYKTHFKSQFFFKSTPHFDGLIFIALAFLFNSCLITRGIKTGETYFAEKQYTVAADLLQSEFNKESDPTIKSRKAFLIGECYRLSGQTIPAEKWYKTAVDINGDDRSQFLFALMLKSNEKYEEAVNAFNEYIISSPFDETAKEELEACNLSIQWKKQPTTHIISNLSSLNSDAYDYAPVLYEKNGLVFTSDRNNSSGEKIYGWTGEKFSDLYVAYSNEEGVFGNATAFPEMINTAYNEGTATFNRNFNECYFTRCGSDEPTNDYCHIYYTYRSGESWSEPVMLPLFGDSFNVSHPFLSPDEKELYVSSDADGGYGGKDLYVLRSTAEGWGEPMNLGPIVNSYGDETFPVVTADDRLCFSSNGLLGMGGLDIYVASRINKQWGNVQNLKSPLNSGADDFGMIFLPVAPERKYELKSHGYFVSNRPGGKGQDDIYFFKEEKIKVYLVKGDVTQKIFEKAGDPNSKIIGYSPMDQVQITMVTLDENGNAVPGTTKNLITSTSGTLRFIAEAEKTYKLTAATTDYFSKSEIASTIGFLKVESDSVTAEVHLILDRIYKNVQVKINNIYYDYDKWNIRPDAALVLDTLATLLKENPNVTVEIGSHTDSRGSDSYNLNLSQKRAQSAVDYLVQNAIAKERLSAKGYGEQMPVNGCTNGVKCTEEQFQENRRTTFRVTSDTFQIDSTAPDQIMQDQSK